MKNFKKAFSLIELSVVLLIIGILIAGVTQSSRLIAQMKLSSARSLTEGSPVPSIKGLTLWLETTSERAFDVELEDGVIMPDGAKWLDRNLQSSQKADASSNTPPIYVASCINSLPCLQFDASASSGLDISQTLGRPEQISVFMVIKTPTDLTPASGDHGMLISTASTFDAGNSPFQIRQTATALDYSFFTSVENAVSIGGVTSVVNTTYILGYLDNGYNISYGYKIGSDTPGVVSNEDANDHEVQKVKDLNQGLNIGHHAGDSYLNGFISEIIIYNRYLKNEERISVLTYLAKKYGLRI